MHVPQVSRYTMKHYVRPREKPQNSQESETAEVGSKLCLNMRNLVKQKKQKILKLEHSTNYYPSNTGAFLRTLQYAVAMQY